MNHAKLARAILMSKKSQREELIQIPKKNLLSSGFTPLDVSCTGTTLGGYGKGLFIFIVGDSSSGKTWLTNTCLAEAANNEEFDDYNFVYDNSENGRLMNVRKFFGRKVAERIQPPSGNWETPNNSVTTEDFYDSLYARLTAKLPCIYIIDSETALMPADDMTKFLENKKLRDKGKVVKGTYGMAKAKANSTTLRVMIPLLEKTGSILIMTSQSRQNVSMFSFEDRTRAGGTSLRFYSHIEMWTKVVKKISKEVQGKKRHIGSIVEIDIKKNRLNGWEGRLLMPFYKSLGIDELGGCVDYLVDEGRWSISSKVINAKDLDLKLKREELVAKIIKDDLQQELKMAVRSCFLDIQKACEINRPRRYV